MAQRPRQARIQFQSQFRSPGVDTSGAEVMRQLAGLGRTVGQIAETVGRPMVEQEMAEMGAKAAETAGTIDPNTGALVAPPEFKKFGWGSQQYNSAVRAGYESNLSTSISNIIADAEVEHSDDLEAYNNSVQGSLKGLMSTVPDEYKGSVNNMIARVGGKASRNIAERQRVKILEETANSVITEADRLEKEILQIARDGGDTSELYGQYVVSLTNLADQGGVDAVKAQASIDGLADNMVVEGVIGEFNRAITAEGDPKSQAFNARAVVEKLRDNPDKRLTPAQNDTLLNKLNAQVTALETKIAQDEEKLSAEEQKIKSDFRIQVGLGLDSPVNLTAKAEQLYRDEVLTPGERADYIIQINKTSEAQRKKAEGKSRVASIVGSDQPTAVSSSGFIPITQNDVNNYYSETYNQALPTDNPDVRSRLQAEFVRKTRFVPEEMAQELTNDLRSGDPERIQNASETIDRIAGIPGATDKISKEDRAFAAQVGFLSQFKGGDVAVQEALVQTDRDDSARIEARKKTIKDNADDFADTYANDMVDIYGTGFFGSEFGPNDIAQYQLVKDYGKLVESYYIGGMDLKNAKKAAQLDITTNYKESEFGFMKFRPEDYYGVGGSVQYMRENLYNEIMGPTGIAGISIRKEDIILVSDDETARTASTGKPTYRVMYKDANGNLNYLMFEGEDKQGNRITLDRYDPAPDVPSEEEQAEIIKRQAEMEMQLKIEQDEKLREIRGTTFGARN